MVIAEPAGPNGADRDEKSSTELHQAPASVRWGGPWRGVAVLQPARYTARCWRCWQCWCGGVARPFPGSGRNRKPWLPWPFGSRRSRRASAMAVGGAPGPMTPGPRLRDPATPPRNLLDHRPDLAFLLRILGDKNASRSGRAGRGVALNWEPSRQHAEVAAWPRPGHGAGRGVGRMTRWT